MSKKLFVGCRVRILYSVGWPELAGMEGRIIGRVPAGDSRTSPDCEWEVAPDCWGTNVAPHLGLNNARKFGPATEQLEPILPSGAAPSEHTFHQLMDLLTAGEVECV